MDDLRQRYKLAMEFSTNYGSNPGGFIIDLNSFEPQSRNGIPWVERFMAYLPRVSFVHPLGLGTITFLRLMDRLAHLRRRLQSRLYTLMASLSL
jgi:hypothetical protein